MAPFRHVDGPLPPRRLVPTAALRTAAVAVVSVMAMAASNGAGAARRGLAWVPRPLALGRDWRKTSASLASKPSARWSRPSSEPEPLAPQAPMAAAAAAALALGGCAAVRTVRVARRARMGFHARDPMGFRHVETRKQAREASIIKTTLESIFFHCEVAYRRIGDDEMQRRVHIDDVIMSKNCRAAYVHVGAEGDVLQKRQTFVWVVRNKGSIKTALAKRFRERGRLPNIYFVESKFEQWSQQFEKARKHPELNLPDPFASLPFRQGIATREELLKKWGAGDINTPFPKRGYQ